MKWFLVAAVFAVIAGGTVAAYFGLIRDSGSSDPGRIAFWQAGQLDRANLYVMNVEGNERPRATLKGFEPAWSPNGDRIAFSVEDREEAPTATGTSGIWTFAPDTRGTLTRLTPPTVFAEFPAWSPDGNLIAFSGFAQSEDVGDANFDIYVVPASGGAPLALTHTPTIDEEEPSWSPDGTKLVYGRWGNEEADSPDIWIMDSDGSDQRALISTPDYDHSPAWSPAGEEIAFMRQYPPSGELTDNNMEIVLVKDDGTGFRRLTRSPYYDSEPAWSPDGEWIVFVSNRAGSDELFVIDVKGGGLEQLTEHRQSVDVLGFPAGDYAGPAWGRSPSG
jgi:TolB protein